MTGNRRPRLEQPIVVRRRGEEPEAETSIGTWKIAYADFVTAMMAFFLLLWLVNISTPEQRATIADYFNPVNVSDANSGANAPLSGRTVTRDGAMTEASASAWETIPAARVPTLSPIGADPRSQESLGGGRPGAPSQGEATGGPAAASLTGQPGIAEERVADLAPGEIATRETDSLDGVLVDAALAEKVARAEAEERAFDRVEASLRQALAAAVELQDAAQTVSVERVAEGLRIQITDRPHFSMFALGSADLSPDARVLMGIVAKALAEVPNPIAVTGHTDGKPFAAGSGLDNWDLSSGRANAARRALTAAGVVPERLAKVEGLADTDHLIPEDPLDPRNRRIGITVLRREG